MISAFVARLVYTKELLRDRLIYKSNVKEVIRTGDRKDFTREFCAKKIKFNNIRLDM